MFGPHLWGHPTQVYLAELMATGRPLSASAADTLRGTRMLLEGVCYSGAGSTGMRQALRDRKAVGTWSDRADWKDAEAYHGREKEIYDGFCRRWRDLSKPTVASVQGKAIAGALMLIWPCDLVIASEDATVQENTLFFGIPGLEYFSHPWELGHRRRNTDDSPNLICATLANQIHRYALLCICKTKDVSSSRPASLSRYCRGSKPPSARQGVEIHSWTHARASNPCGLPDSATMRATNSTSQATSACFSDGCVIRS